LIWGWEQALFLAIVLLACAVTLGTRTASMRLMLFGFLASLLFALGIGSSWTPPSASIPDLLSPQKVEDQGYVSSETCRACHLAEYTSWQDSYHRTMTQVASPEAIAAPHESADLEGNGRRFAVHFQDGAMWAEDIHPYATLDRLASVVRTLPGPTYVSSDKQPIPDDFKQFRSRVVMTTGSHHMQMYWHRDRRGAFRHLSWVWLIRDQRWVPGESVYLQPPEGIKCHSVGGQPRIALHNPSSVPRESKVGELGIACEACHGPGLEHIRANRNPTTRYTSYLTGDDDPTIVHPNKLSHQRSSDICGRCHSGHQHTAWDRDTGTPFKAGDSLESYFRLRHFDTQPPDERGGYFWNDGTARVTGREYSAMIESACFTRGELACSSCHSMHGSDPDDQLSAGRDTDDSCLQCHESYANRIEEHTHHQEGSSGARCYNCHMPNTTYGLLSLTRSHRIDNPGVAMSTRTGRPNACNLCHVDQTLAWADEHLSAWYGQEPVELTVDQQSVPAAALWLLKGDPAQRATAAWHFGWDPVLERAGTGWQTPLLARSLEDPYAAVRYLSERSLRRFPAYQDFSYDFVESADHQSDAVKEALEISREWLEEPAPRIPTDLVDRLRAERDETPTSFQE
jgi:predicted CXXCH cytochrome family protein